MALPQFRYVIRDKPRASSEVYTVIEDETSIHCGEIKWIASRNEYCFFPVYKAAPGLAATQLLEIMNKLHTLWFDRCARAVRPPLTKAAKGGM